MQKSKSMLLPLIIIILMAIVLVFSITYAYYVNQFDVNDTTLTSVSTGYMDISFTTNNYFNNTSMVLIEPTAVLSEADYTEFVVEPNGGTVSTIKYDIYFTELVVSNNFKSPYFKWALYEGNNIINSGDFSTIGSLTNKKLTENQINMTTSSSPVTYRVYVWLENDDDVNQNNLLSGSFSGKIAINATSPNP